MRKRYPDTAITTVCIPWDEQWNFDRAVFGGMVEKLIEAGLPALYLFGTAGEGYAVDDEQFQEIAAAFWDDTRGSGIRSMVGIISLSVSEMIHRIEIAYQLGFREFQISFPSWGALTDEEVMVFFHHVCDPFPDCIFMHYNNGGRSKKLLSYKHYQALAEEIPNLAAVKYMNDSIEDIICVQTADLPIQFILSEYGYGTGCLYGECGLLFSSSVICPEAAWALYRAGKEKNMEEIRRLEIEVAVSQQILFETCPQQVMNAAYDKLYAKMLLPEMPLRLYPPYQGFSVAQFEAFRTQMQLRLPRWLAGKNGK